MYLQILNMKIQPSPISLFMLMLLWLSGKVSAQENLVLHYDKPAQSWMEEALPLGNGYMGVMFFGGIAQEQLQFTEGTLWSGGPHSGDTYRYGNKENSWKYLDQVRQLIHQGNLDAANNLARKHFTGLGPQRTDGMSEWGDYGGQVTMGDLYVSIGHGETAVSDYRRQLDISRSLALVSYRVGSVKYQREYFGNYPSGMMVYKFSSSKRSDYSVTFKSPHNKDQEQFSNGMYTFRGHINDNRQAFQTSYRIQTDGQLTFINGVLTVQNASEIVLFHTAATDYRMEYPHYKGNDYQAQILARYEKIKNHRYQDLKREHLGDYTNLFN